MDSDDIRRLDRNTVLSSRVVRQLNLYLDTQDTLLELDVTDGEVDVVDDGVTGLLDEQQSHSDMSSHSLPA